MDATRFRMTIVVWFVFGIERFLNSMVGKRKDCLCDASLSFMNMYILSFICRTLQKESRKRKPQRFCCWLIDWLIAPFIGRYIDHRIASTFLYVRFRFCFLRTTESGWFWWWHVWCQRLICWIVIVILFYVKYITTTLTLWIWPLDTLGSVVQKGRTIVRYKGWPWIKVVQKRRTGYVDPLRPFVLPFEYDPFFFIEIT